MTETKHAIILPLKESFTEENAGAVSIWANTYLKNTKKKNIFIFASKTKGKSLDKKKTILIDSTSNILTNLNYIKKITQILISKNFTSAEIHNRPEYAKYLINNTNLKTSLIFHNDPDNLRSSKKPSEKKFLLDNCDNIIFVSNFLKKRFLNNIKIKFKNNIKIIYNSVKPIKKFPKKKNIVIFAGKLNSQKGYNIFGKAIIKILNKNKTWKAYVFGNEPREKYDFFHKNLKIYNWISHKKLINFYKQASISVVNPKWSEPFGRTALESAALGCAVITSISGGLQETFNNNLILKKNDEKYLISMIQKLIDNKKYLRKIQKENFTNIKHKVKDFVKNLDETKEVFKINYKKNKYYRILHVSNFGEKLNHRIFNLSIAKKITNGLIRNGHDVIDFDYRDHKNNFLISKLDKKIIDICKNYRPNLLILGHNNHLQQNTLEILKTKYDAKIALWYEDHLVKGDPSYAQNLNLIEKNSNLIDQYFVTTHPSVIKTKIKKSKINFMPIPTDKVIENGEFYNCKKTKDLFFALSHGVNYGKLKKGLVDERYVFVNDLLRLSNNKYAFNFLGLYDQEPKWNFDFNNELMTSKTALNLSRGGPNKYASSNRLATLMGNGCVTFIDRKVYYQDFFSDNEMIFYRDKIDLLNKLDKLIGDDNKLKKIGRNAKIKYHQLFSNVKISKFIVSKTLDEDSSLNYDWK